MERFYELKNKIEEIFETFKEEYGYLTEARTGLDDEEIYLEDALREVLEEYSDIAQVSCVESMTTFESCGYDCGVISVAFINPFTGLETYLEKWERL